MYLLVMKKLFVCPKCGSVDAKTPQVYDQAVTSLQPSIDIRKCGNCSYQGPFLEIDGDELEDLQKKIKKLKNP